MVIKKELKNTKDKIIEKNDIVTLSYKLYDAKGKIIDQSYPEQPLVLQYLKTNINKELEKQLKGKTVGTIINIKQKIISKAPEIEVSYDDLDEEDLENIHEGQELELSVAGKTNLFIVEKLSKTTATALLRYKNPYEGTTVTNKIKIEKILKLEIKK